MKLPCQNPNHPFKTKMYDYNPTGGSLDSTKYCTSCMSFMKSTKQMLFAILMPRETLYGNQMIELTRQQTHDLIDEVFDEQP